ncbi:hypothetical protein R1flu_019664 [Riccia fluitans]|uniref:Uncharacterized protein n=1 Tax=Riccia fluitans TaxID=41844 RepID=A0ABD1ZKV4_9MARC
MIWSIWVGFTIYSEVNKVDRLQQRDSSSFALEELRKSSHLRGEDPLIGKYIYHRSMLHTSLSEQILYRNPRSEAWEGNEEGRGRGRLMYSSSR